MKKKQTQVTEKTDVLGIISLVFAFTALQIPGLIIGIVGEKEAKKEGRSPILSRIGWITNLVIIAVIIAVIVAVVVVFPRYSNNNDDAIRKADIKYFSQKLENFYDSYGYYPATLEQFSTPTIDLNDPDNRPYEYTPEPADCTKCGSYRLKTILTFPHNDGSGWMRMYEVKSQHKNRVNNNAA